MSKQGRHHPVVTKLLDRADAVFRRVTTGNYNRSNNHSARDCLMSALAMFFFKMPSMLKLDEASHVDPIMAANLRTLFGIEHVPSDTTLRHRLDAIETKWVQRLLCTTFGWARRHRLLDPFRTGYFGNLVPVMIDGTGYVDQNPLRPIPATQNPQWRGQLLPCHVGCGGGASRGPPSLADGC